MLCYGKMKDLNVREAGSRLNDSFAVDHQADLTEAGGAGLSTDASRRGCLKTLFLP